MHKAWLDHRYEIKSKYLMNRLNSPSIKYIYNKKNIYAKMDTILISTTLKPPIFTPLMAEQSETTNTSSMEKEKSSTNIMLTKQTISNNPIPYSDLLRNVSSDSLNASGKLRSRHAHWSVWNNWSQCSRSCGRGITTQIRKCLLM